MKATALETQAYSASEMQSDYITDPISPTLYTTTPTQLQCGSGEAVRLFLKMNTSESLKSKDKDIRRI